MGRPPLPVGGYGDILARRDGNQWLARTYVRDVDGRRREVKRWRAKKTDAVDAVQQALRDRPGFADTDITAETRLRQVAARWLETVEAQVADEALSSDTARVYRSIWDVHLEPALGELRVREATTVRLEAFMLSMAKADKSASVRRTSRTVLSAVMGCAVRHGAADANPVRELSRIVARNKRPARSLTAEEIVAWVAFLDSDRGSRAHDLGDLTVLMLATGCRISEMLAVHTEDVDVKAETIRLDYRIKRIKGQGLVRVLRSPNSSKGRGVVLRLPEWGLTVCRKRILELGGDGPMFPTATGNYRDAPTTLHALARAREKVGLDWVTSHVYRKTVATLLDQGGVTTREVADQLTHRQLTLTQNTYMGRGVVGDRAARVLDLHDPRQLPTNSLQTQSDATDTDRTESNSGEAS